MFPVKRLPAVSTLLLIIALVPQARTIGQEFKGHVKIPEHKVS
jgi:hypothetical protein